MRRTGRQAGQREGRVRRLREEILKTQSETSPSRMRRALGAVCLAVALLLTGWLLLGILNVVPLVLHLPGASTIRSHAGAAVLLLMIAAGCYWED